MKNKYLMCMMFYLLSHKLARNDNLINRRDVFAESLQNLFYNFSVLWDYGFGSSANPFTRRQSATTPTNLTNQNNSCYADSVLRCLYIQRDFVVFIYDVSGFLTLRDRKNSLIGSLHNLFQIMDSKTDNTICFDVIWNFFENQKNPNAKFGRPQDIQDFLQFIIQRIEVEILQFFPDHNKHYLIKLNQFFSGEIYNYYGNKKNPLSFQYIFHNNYYLPCKSVENTINQTMEKRNELEGINDKEADNYQIEQLPDRIIIPISRNYGEVMADPPLNICKELDFKDIPEFWNCPLTIREVKYDLDALITKSYKGRCKVEHYYCYCKINGVWYLFNGFNSKSTIIDNNETKKILNNNTQVTMIFYTKRNLN